MIVVERGTAVAWPGAKWKAVLLDFLERAGWSAGQVFFATLLAGGAAVSTADLPWKYSATIAVSAAVSSVILTALQYAAKLTDLPFWPDLLVRLAKTFLGSLAASIVTSGVFDITRFHWSTALNVAFVATITALGKGLLAREHLAVGPAPAPAEPELADRPAAEFRTSPSTLSMTTYLDAVERLPHDAPALADFRSVRR
jgi:hypothetical protein